MKRESETSMDCRAFVNINILLGAVWETIQT